MTTNDLQEAHLAGGPCDGQRFKVRADQATLSRPRVDPSPAKPGRLFVATDYRRTARLTSDGAVVFEYRGPP